MTNKILIMSVYKEYCGDKVRLYTSYKENNEEKLFYYEVNKTYDEYLVDDRADAFVVAFINYALLKGLDIDSKIPISTSIYYSLINHYIPTLTNLNKNYKPIIYSGDYICDIVNSGNAIATGMSRGVDSFTSFSLNYYNDVPEIYKINTLTFFDIGSSQSSLTGKFSKKEIIEFKNRDIIKSIKKIEEERFNGASKVARELGGLPIIRISSNIQEVQNIKHKYVHSLRSISAVLSMQKYFKIYYFASTVDINATKIDHTDPSYYDLLTLNLFSTKATRFIQGDIAYSRLKKTDIISNIEISYNNLNVCWRDAYNCGRCNKCIRTLVTLDFLNKLENYKNVFDINQYYKNRERNIAHVFINRKNDIFYKEIYWFYKKNKINIKKIKRFKYYKFYLYFKIKKTLKKIFWFLKKN